MHSRYTIVIATSGFLLLAILSACKKQEQFIIPEGPQTISGSLSPVELSLTRRGTHILRSNDKELVYIESSSVNLRTYEGMDVMIHGNVEKNTEANQLPVLVADTVSLIARPTRRWNVSSLRLSFDAPLEWGGTTFTDAIRFIDASNQPLVRIAQSSLTALPSGTPLIVGGKQAVRVDTASGQLVYVQNDKNIIAISIDRSLSGSAGKSPSQSIVRLLTSMTFAASTSSGSLLPFGTGSTNSAGGLPCGGSAGILCPVGSFCNITDRTSGVGFCRFLPTKEQQVYIHTPYLFE